MFAKLENNSISVSATSQNGYKPLIENKPDGDYVFTYYEETEDAIIKVYVPRYREPYVPTLDELKKNKISEMSNICHQIITNGVDVEINGNISHFSLTNQDQINLLSKRMQLNNVKSINMLSYHVDDQLCKYYTPEQIDLIITKSMEHIDYNITYFNSLKFWIQNIDNTEELNNLYYSITIPKEYRSEVLQDYHSTFGIYKSDDTNMTNEGIVL